MWCLTRQRTIRLGALLVLAVAVSTRSVGQEPPEAQKRPEALERLVAYHAALRTGQLELSVTEYNPGFSVDAGRMKFQTVKFAGDHAVTIHRGDEDGVTIRTTDGNPDPRDGRSPYYVFSAPGQSIMRPESPLSPAFVTEYPSGVRKDGRSLGATCGMPGLDVRDAIWRDNVPNPVARTFQESREGHLHVVRVRSSTGTTTYWIDPQRGWSLVRVRDDYDNGAWGESRSALKLMDGVWFPVGVEVYSSRYQDGREPAKVVRVHSATFNRPEHPQELTTADIGLECGMRAVCMGKNGLHGTWDGERVVTWQEFRDRLKRGEVQESPSLTRAVSGGMLAGQARQRKAGSAGRPTGPQSLDELLAAIRQQPRQVESLWEAYVRKFIARYKLNPGQSERALAILKDCQGRGRQYLRKHKADFDRLDGRLQKTREPGPGGGAEARRAAVHLRERAALHTGPSPRGPSCRAAAAVLGRAGHRHHADERHD